MEKKNDIMTRVADKLKSSRKLEAIVYGIIILAVLLIFISTLTGDPAKTEVKETDEPLPRAEQDSLYPRERVPTDSG